jgi:peptidoglycan/xylan/chitin deacetylase (PgdA/CDA1 family)
MSITRQVPLVLVLGCGAGHHGGTGDGGGSNNNGDGGAPTACKGGLGDWTGKDNVAASQAPPCGLKPEEVPQFVSIGWDDNGQVGGMTWAVDMLKDRGKASFFLTCTYMQAAAWKAAYMAGHEIGNHTVSHATDRNVGLPRWLQEMNDCNKYITEQVGVPADEIIGFRTPFLKYDTDTLAAVKQVGFRYDTSIEEGYEWDDKANASQDGTNYFWPYTLDNRSPGHTTQVEWGEGLKEIDPQSGLWELPVYAVVVPPDAKCQQYGVEPGLRMKLKQRQTWFDVDGGLITGFDYNLWASTSVGGFAMTKAEFVATLKYTLDQRLAGNRSPFLFGAHTDYYVASWNMNAAGTPSEADRRAAIEEFLDYAKMKKEVEITTYKDVLEYVRNPKVR